MATTLALLSSCAADSKPAPKAPKDERVPVVYELADQAWTTLKKVWLPTDAPKRTRTAILDGSFRISYLPEYEQYGLLNLQTGAGEPHIRYAPFGEPAVQGTRRSMLYFAQLSDFQISDVESPIRLEGVTRFAFASAFRAQDHLTTQLTDSLIRSLNRYSFEDRPLDFVVLTGDLSDTSSEVEMWWVRQLLDGGVITPDTGKLDDPIPGSGNDFADPFTAAGIDPRVPYYVIPGNHDQSWLGTFDTTERVQEAAVSNRIDDFLNLGALSDGDMSFGVRDQSRPYAPVVREGRVHPDPRRRLMTIPEMMAVFLTSPTLPLGHGFTEEAAEKGLATWSARPVTDFPLVLIGMDTNLETKFSPEGDIIQHASANGGMPREVWENTIIPALDAAQNNGDFIILGSHHCTVDMAETASEVKGAEMRAKFVQYPNVLAHLCGHGHNSEMWERHGVDAEHSYIELMMPSAIDFPVQARVLELVDNGNGTVSLYATGIEPNVDISNPAWEALAYSAAAHNFPIGSLFSPGEWELTKDTRNIEVVLPITPAMGARLAAIAPKPNIESLGRLQD